MTILHFSDTHLGYSELDKVGPKGINLREQDFYDAFSLVIDQALEINPDLMIHSGDFFHRPSPPNRPMIFALEQMNRLSAANIPIVIIAGNHSTPKTIYTSPILRAFKTIKGVYPIFGQCYEQITFGDLIIHGLPHINDEALQLEEVKKIKTVDGKRNILMLHTSIGKDYIMEEYGEQLFPPERMEVLDQFDYVALGHWHNFQKVKSLKSAWYCGSTERMSDTEAGKEKGFCLLTLEADLPVEPKFIPIATRPWYRIDIKDCIRKSVDQIETEITSATQSLALEDALLNVYLHDLQAMQSLNLSNRRIFELLPGPIHIQVKRHFAETESPGIELAQKSERLDQLISDFIHGQVEENTKAKKLAKQAKYYFELFESGEYKNR